MTHHHGHRPAEHEPAVNDVVVVDDPDWLRREVYANPLLADRRDLFTTWLTDPTPREDIAERLGLSLGELLRRFNTTAALGDPLPFTYRSVPYTCVPMNGTCDDIADGRWPLFGDPVTLRCYLADETLLPQGMFEAADWNFMDAGLRGFVGYAYGAHHDGTLYLAGLQSDLGVRYGYLFQARSGGTEVRSGDDVVARAAEDLVFEYGRYVPVLRRVFQRYWIPVLLGSVVRWARSRADVHSIGFLQFDYRAEERGQGHVVRRVYQELPERLDATARCVRVNGRCHVYRVSTLDKATDYLGDRWSPRSSAPSMSVSSSTAMP